MKRITVLLMGLILVLWPTASCAPNAVPAETEPSAAGTTAREQESTENDAVSLYPEPEAAELLGMVKSFSQRQEWEDEILLALGESSTAVLAQESTQAYPALAQVLEQTQRMASRSGEDEFDNLLASAKEELSLLGADSFVSKLSTLDVQIRRADSAAVSFLWDSTLVYGKINGRFLQGITYDTESGKQLTLTDVITDMSRIPAIVKKELTAHTWKGAFFSETAVEDYFRETPEDSIVWTLDYNGVSFYFANDDVADLGDGRLMATVSFAQYPDLFVPKYRAVPPSYIVELGLNHPFCTDLDGDGTLNELSVTPVLDESGLGYESIDIYTDTEAQYYHTELRADILHRTGGYHPYYLKTADGRHYLYLFAEGSELAAGDMKLRVIDITGGGFQEAGDMHVAPGYVPVDCSHALTDPENMMLENFAAMQEAEPYRVGDDGMPVRK